MSEFSSYYLYQEFELRGEQEAIPVYPNVYSIDADGTRERVVKLENDPQCGYEPQAIYRWTNIPITEDYVCDDCPDPQYRWVNMDASVDYYCEGTTKYYKQKKQVSYDSGATWTDVVPAEYQKGGVAETESTDCGYVPPTPDPQYRWVNMDASVDYYCEGTTKYYKQKKQVSYDSGATWTDVVPAEYQKGGVAETESTDCGYVPPTPTGKKLVATYTSGTTNEVDCNDNSTLTSGETRPTSAYRRMTSAVIGQCVTSIGVRAFSGCTSLTSVTIPNSVTSISDYAFAKCSGLTSVTIPNSVTSLGYEVFSSCRSLASVIIPNSVTSTSHGVFLGCYSLTSAVIGSGLTKIEQNVFADCSGLTSVSIPDSITSISYYAFLRCTSLTSVTIPSSVAGISSWAFSGCTSLTSITILATTPQGLGENVFDDTNNCPIYVPAQSVDAYKSATNWSTYADRIQPIS